MFHPPGAAGILQILAGGVLFWLPGLTWTWAFTPGLAWAYRLPLSIVAAFTVQPGFMLFLNLVLYVPITLATTAMLSATLALVGLAAGLGRSRRLDAVDE